MVSGRVFMTVGRTWGLLLLLLYLVTYLPEGGDIVFVLCLLAVVDDGDPLVVDRGLYLLCALDKTDVALDFVLAFLSVHLRQSGYGERVGRCLGNHVARCRKQPCH